MQYRTALVVGRFQPFHTGHLYLLKKAFSLAEELVIAIGSSNVHNNDNPLTYEQRVQMLKIVLERENLQDRIKKVVPSPDFPDDEQWRNTLLENAGEFQISLGNNDWTNSVLASAGYEVLTVPHLDREIFQGQYIRKLFREHKNWQERVPEYLQEYIQQNLT